MITTSCMSIHLPSVRSNCVNGNVRLVNGTTPYEGRVEICYGGVWGSVCDYNWDYKDAAIVCLQMGFQGTSISARFTIITIIHNIG